MEHCDVKKKINIIKRLKLSDYRTIFAPFTISSPLTNSISGYLWNQLNNLFSPSSFADFDIPLSKLGQLCWCCFSAWTVFIYYFCLMNIKGKDFSEWFDEKYKAEQEGLPSDIKVYGIHLFLWKKKITKTASIDASRSRNKR